IRSDIEPRLIAPLFIGMIEQVAQPAFLLNLPFGVSEVIDAISSMLLGGILSEAGRQMFLSSKAAGITSSPAATGHEKGVSP
ncbi:MAG TPA: hypothetical protein VFL04_03130, partial [Rectinemataceae bacterium]|nr:hypothetical protein [Rectinemataceae bacterium]